MLAGWTGRWRKGEDGDERKSSGRVKVWSVSCCATWQGNASEGEGMRRMSVLGGRFHPAREMERPPRMGETRGAMEATAG